MKKYLLLTFAGVLFASVSAFAHCGTCGVGDGKAHENAKAECPADCTKPCCGKKADCAADCAKACSAKKAGCAADCAKACCAKKKECAEGCTKPCCAKPAKADSAEPTAATSAPSCCAAKATAPA